jgi:NAD-dependent dihydropyrimidine dehydrogenase PreA subunit
MSRIFIDIDVADQYRDDTELARKLAEVCPVDIYAEEGGKVAVVDENVDECVLCGLCLDASPDGAVTVKKLYDGTVLERKP